MSYKERERTKVIAIRDKVFRDPGNGIYSNIPREFVLSNPTLNLCEGIREDALDYFCKNQITWHDGINNGPTGHLLSSQIACINHLYFVRQRQDAATAILKNIQADIEKAVFVDDGYVEFEFIGDKQYMKERVWSRGVNCTSVDAVMIGESGVGKKIMFLIEWKYTEAYSFRSKYIPERANIYDPLIKDVNSPFIKLTENDVPKLYCEPFYQLMRQTLLGWQCALNNDHCCTEYYHVHVIPDSNTELKNKIPPGYSGTDISTAWKSVLKEPDKYLVISPEALLKPCQSLNDCKSITSYLNERYW